jgi:anti-anti-sigma factor
MIALHYFDVEQSGEVTELRLADPALFDVPRFEELRNELVSFVERQRPDRLIVDFSAVGYCSTAVIASVLMAKKRLDSEGGQMKLCGMSDAVRETFQMLRLDGTIFDIRTTKADAANAF